MFITILVIKTFPHNWVNEEFYFKLRFAENKEKLTPILTLDPEKEDWERVVGWAFERPNGGRGFGFTGAHFHKNWADDSFRKVVLNALLWISKMDVPPDGVASTVSAEQIMLNLDDKRRGVGLFPLEVLTLLGL